MYNVIFLISNRSNRSKALYYNTHNCIIHYAVIAKKSYKCGRIVPKLEVPTSTLTDFYTVLCSLPCGLLAQYLGRVVDLSLTVWTLAPQTTRTYNPCRLTSRRMCQGGECRRHGACRLDEHNRGINTSRKITNCNSCTRGASRRHRDHTCPDLPHVHLSRDERDAYLVAAVRRRTIVIIILYVLNAYPMQ